MSQPAHRARFLLREPAHRELWRVRAVCQNRRMRRIAEIVGALAMATDLGLGLPTEHAIRACLMSVELGRRLGMAPAELSELYYLTLLRIVGCTSGSPDIAYSFGD